MDQSTYTISQVHLHLHDIQLLGLISDLGKRVVKLLRHACIAYMKTKIELCK